MPWFGVWVLLRVGVWECGRDGSDVVLGCVPGLFWRERRLTSQFLGQELLFEVNSKWTRHLARAVLVVVEAD